MLLQAGSLGDTFPPTCCYRVGKPGKAVHHGMWRTTREVDPSREGQLDMVGVFNLCRARPRQMTMGRVVSPLQPSWPSRPLAALLFFDQGSGQVPVARREGDAADAVEES